MWINRPSYYLDANGLCRNPARLAHDLLTGLKDHGFIEQAAHQANALQQPEPTDSAMSVDSDMFQNSQSQSQARSKASDGDVEPLKTAMTGFVGLL